MQFLPQVIRCINGKHGVCLPTNHQSFKQLQWHIVGSHGIVEVCNPVDMCGWGRSCGGVSHTRWSGGTGGKGLGWMIVIVIVTNIAEIQPCTMYSGWCWSFTSYSTARSYRDGALF